jgi:imidazolonepropionase-like amidohydrolase
VAIDTGLIPGPRMVAGSRDISSTGHSQDAFFPWFWAPMENPNVLACDGADAVRRGIRTEIKRGAEFIKVFLTPGHGVYGPQGAVELTVDEMNAAVETAHERGVKIRAHIANIEGIHAALDAGFDLIDHGDGLDEKSIERIVAAGVFVCPSMLYPHVYNTLYKDELGDVMAVGLEQMLKILPVANKAGVKLVLGDDYGSPALPHGTYADELDFYVNVAGIPARDVLRWATRYGAELMDRGHELGAVKAGYLADLLVVQGDPLADIAVLKDRSRILAILKDGAFHKDELASLKPAAQAAELQPAE